MRYILTLSLRPHEQILNVDFKIISDMARLLEIAETRNANIY